ncbi:hypothetical protein [Streptomyces sp. NPDC093223]|uniref:hypothetical protein n=1 Tax=Streptomyces sp. NPDC093223 TaxID=3366033 RepID=UPI0038079309
MTSVPYGRFCHDSDAADERRGEIVPTDQLPGVTDGRAKLHAALRLLADPAAPGALDAARRKVADALDLIPQSGRDQHCREYRWRSGTPVCSVRTCGRCAPLRAAEGPRS